MIISNKKDLRAIELACNSAMHFHHQMKIEAAKKVDDDLNPSHEELLPFYFHEEHEKRYQKLSQAAAQQQETMTVHEKAAS